MTLARLPLVIQDEDGNIVDGASIEVRRETPGLPLVSVFSDRDGAVALGNPFTAADGRDAGFHVAGGAYKITATKDSFSMVRRYEKNGLGGESDAVPVDGANAGFKYTFNTATAGDPGTGAFLFNHATFGSITALNISETDADGNALAALIARWDDGTSTIRGDLSFVKPTTGAFRTFDITGTLTDNGGYDTFSATPIASGGTISNGDECYVFFIPKGDKGDTGAAGISGTSATTRIRVVATSNVVIATALENGDSIDSVTLATNDLVLLTAQTAPEENGVYVVPASGAASRHTDFDAYDDLPGTLFSVMEGTAKADTIWRCTSDRGGTIGVTAIVISEFQAGGDVSAAAAFAVDNVLIKSDGTAKGVQATGITIADTTNAMSGVGPISSYINDTSTAPQIKAEQDDTGDAAFTALLTGGVQWTWGIDNSDSDKWKLASSAALGTSDKLVLTTGGDFGFGTASPLLVGTVPQTNAMVFKGQIASIQGGNADGDGCLAAGTFGFMSANNWSGWMVVGANITIHSTGGADMWRTPFNGSGYAGIEFRGTSGKFLRLAGATTAGGDVTPTYVGTFTDGLVWGAPTGGDKGAGAINAQAVYDDNTLLTCYVFDAAIDGTIDAAKWDAKVANYSEEVFTETVEGVVVDGKPVLDAAGQPVRRPVRTAVIDQATGKPARRVVAERIHDPLRKFAARLGTEYDPLDIDKYTQHWRDKRHLTSLPNMDNFDPEIGMPTGALVQRLWETVEIQAVHIAKLNERLKAAGL